MTSAVSIPSRPADITAEWLTPVLGADVRAVTTAPIGTGQTGATYRVSVSYADQRTGLPATFAVKLPSQNDTVRDRVAIGYRSEHAFYTNVAEHVGIPVPSVTTARSQATEPTSCCCSPIWPLLCRATRSRLLTSGGDAGRRGAGGPARAHLVRRPLGEMSVVTPWLLAEPDRFAVLHGDYRLDNMLFDPDRRRMTVVDWQTLGAGLPARDLSYFTATSLQPDIRSTIEAELVDAYHRKLLDHGISDYDRDACWTDYRLGMLQAPPITVLGAAFATSTERGDEMMLVMASRGCQAIRDLGTLDLISA